jgi:dephospho-CoA kinase
MKPVAGVYLIGGITLISEIALPELPLIQQQSATPHPVQVRLGAVANHLSGAVELDPDCFATPTQYLLNIQGVARYLVTAGREIVVDLAAAAPALDVRGYLLGSIFVVLCQQRGLLPLHASAIAGKSGVVAFLGNSGQGKSTLAAHLAQRGFRVLADDVCLIDATEPSVAMVIPTAPWLKLWRTSLENLGREAEGLDRVFTDDDKYRLPLAPVLTPEPILRLVFLEGNEIASTKTEIEEVPRVQAVPLLMNLTHHSYLLEVTGQQEENFRRCGRVLSQARAYRLFRPWGLMHLESTVDALENLLLEV